MFAKSHVKPPQRQIPWCNFTDPGIGIGPLVLQAVSKEPQGNFNGM